MKRIGNLFDEICSIDNLHIADALAQRGKATQRGVQRHNLNQEQNIIALHELLTSGRFETSRYCCFTILEPKERLIYSLPYYPDRIVQHAIMNVLEPVFVSYFTADTYSCIKGRGIHLAARNVKKALRDTEATRYCLKLDIRKFYPSVDHGVLKSQLRRKFKDIRLLQLLDNIIDSAPGLPIGNYLSQYFANFYLTGFDHWIKEVQGVQHYFRYADDVVILSGSKEELHGLLADIRQYLLTKLNLHVKHNYQVFPVASRGIDFLGYKFYHTHTLMRKSIKQRFAREVAGQNRPASVASYAGWAKHCNSRNLLKTLN